MRKITALATRAMRVDARSLTPHLMRMGLAFFILMQLVSAGVAFSSQAPGKTFFQSIIYTNAIFASFVVTLLFANSITEEKEERTLPLLQIADVPALSILLGKFAPRMISILLILVVQLPYSLLAVTLGGVTLHQVLASYLAVAAYVVLIGNVSLWCSVIFRTTANAAGLAGILVLLYHALPALAHAILIYLQNDSVFGPVAVTGLKWMNTFWQTNVFVQLSQILAAGGREPYFSLQFASNMVIGCLFFGLSWMVFDWFNREIEAAPVARRATRRKAGSARRSRVWSHALVWKDFRFVAGGRRSIAYRMIAYSLLAFIVTGTHSGWNLRRIDLEESASIVAALLFFGFIPMEVALLVGATFHREVKDKTIANLMMLPKSTATIAYSKLAGAFIGVIPSLFFLLLSLAFAPEIVNEILKEIGRSENFLLGGIIIANVVAHLLLYYHLVAYISLSFNGWWALFIAYLVQYFGCIVPVSLVGIFVGAFNIRVPDGVEYLIGILAAAVVFVLVVLLHLLIGRALEKIAAA
ncbi:ABC-2 family transporter protein [Thalassoglobus neptunius]|uniref:ABC-2 family transporter protein n=1 Tax=Thalassoglobus neptunius TaxID=1938619 RepID=A0A5C5VV46_9PLAN|nr:ABC transporter permease subunit [Thalassoglobus neptunius]TWT41481.1 ABC-2 family transporter protein [Thalassoglobus neptunius]